MPWITGSFMPMPSTRRRTTSTMRSSHPASASLTLAWTAAVSFVFSIWDITDSRRASSSTPRVKDVPPFRSSPRRIFSPSGVVTQTEKIATASRTSHFHALARIDESKLIFLNLISPCQTERIVYYIYGGLTRG